MRRGIDAFSMEVKGDKTYCLKIKGGICSPTFQEFGQLPQCSPCDAPVKVTLKVTERLFRQIFKNQLRNIFP